MEEQITKTLIESQYPIWMIVSLFIGIQLIIVFFAELIKKKIEKKTISGFTRKIKSVESQFMKEIEILKSVLNVQSQAQTLFIQQRNEAIVDFWSKYMNWNETFMGSWRNNADNNHIINELIQKEKDNDLAVTLAYHKLILYIDDNSYIENLHMLLSKMSEIIFKQRMLLFEIQDINLNNPNDNVTRSRKLTSFATECTKLQGNEIKELTDKFIKESKEYLSDINIKSQIKPEA